MDYLRQIWWTIKWAFIRNRKPKVKHEEREVHYAFPPMDLRMPDNRVEDLSDGALD